MSRADRNTLNSSSQPANGFHWRRIFQYRLRTLLILTTIIAAWFAWWTHTVRKQREAVEALRKADAQIQIIYSFVDDPKGLSDWPTWLVNLLGEDYFGHVRSVSFWISTFGNAKVTDADLEPLQDLPGLETFSARSEEVSDAGMAHFQGLTSLKKANLIFPRVTDVGIANLKPRKPLPLRNPGFGRGVETSPRVDTPEGTLDWKLRVARHHFSSRQRRPGPLEGTSVA